MVKRFLAIALTVVLAITTVWAVVPLSAFADEMPVYRASEEYEADLHYNPTAHWEWDYYDAAAERYEKLPYLRNQTSGSRGFSISGSYDACTAVGQYNLYGDTRKNNEGGFIKDDTYEYSWQRYNPTRTFTVPQSGNITITADDGQGGTRITTDGTAAPNLRIRLERSGDYTQVWPTDNEWQSVSADEPVNFGTLILNIKKGDKLHFELSAQHANTSSCWRMRAYWDPVVKYNSFVSIADFQPSAVEQLPLNQVFTITTEGEMESVSASDVSIAGTTNAAVRDFSFTEGNTISFAFDGLVYNGTYEVEVGGLKPVGSSGEGEVYRFTFTTFTLKQYQASDYYDASGKSNPYTMGKEAPWSWESYDLKTKTYTLLPSFNSSRGYAIVDNYNAVTAVSDSAMYGDTRQSGQGGFTADETYTYAWQRYYPVRTFTVPESGKVTVSEADGTITAPSSAAPGLRILLERNGEFTQLWPETGWKSVNVSAPVCFAPMVQNVIEGDKLHFELSAVDASASSCWTMYANWNPVVAYNEKHPTVTEIFPENGAVNVPGNTEFVVNFSQEICEPSV